MLDNLTLLAIIITALWLIAIGYFIYVSRQHKALSQEIDDLKQLLDGMDEQSD